MREKARSYFIIPGLVILPFLFIYLSNDENTNKDLFIRGINLEAPPQPFDSTALKRIKEVHADWISIVPYAFTSTESARVYFDEQRQWWGERSEGVIACIEMAQQLGLNVMIKHRLYHISTATGSAHWRKSGNYQRQKISPLSSQNTVIRA